MGVMDWDAVWRCLVNQISRVSISLSWRDDIMIPQISWPVWMYTWTSIIQNKSSPIVACVTAKMENENGLCGRMWIGWIRHCFLSIYYTLVRPALDGCDSALVRIKFPRDREGWSVTPSGKKGWDGVFGNGKGRKEVLLPQQKVTSPVMDGQWSKNPLISLPILQHTFFFFMRFHLFWNFLNLICTTWTTECGLCITVWSCTHNLVY